MAIKTYVGVSDKARKVKKIYVGVSNVARKVKKAYVGVGGVARPCFNGGGGTLSYYGKITSLSKQRCACTGVAVGSYGLVAGGETAGFTGSGNGATNIVDAYNTSLVRSTPTALSVARSDTAGVRVGEYALVAGGLANNSIKDTVDAYSTSLARSTPTALSVARSGPVGASAGTFGLFGGGSSSNTIFPSGVLSTVDAYNTSLVRSTPTSLSVARVRFAGASAGTYGLFGGGTDLIKSGGSASGGPRDTVDAYSATLVRTSPAVLSNTVSANGGTSAGSYGLFGGGVRSSSEFKNTVDAYSSNLVRSTPTALSTERNLIAGVSVGDFGLFGGGSNTNVLNKVDAYNSDLVRSTPTALSTARAYISGVCVGGKFGLFCGGTNGTTNNSLSDAEAYMCA